MLNDRLGHHSETYLHTIPVVIDMGRRGNQNAWHLACQNQYILVCTTEYLLYYVHSLCTPPGCDLLAPGWMVSSRCYCIAETRKNQGQATTNNTFLSRYVRFCTRFDTFERESSDEWREYGESGGRRRRTDVRLSCCRVRTKELLKKAPAPLTIECLAQS